MAKYLLAILAVVAALVFSGGPPAVASGGTISLSPTSGPPGTNVTVHGDGWVGYNSLLITISQTGGVGTIDRFDATSISAAGSFDTPITIPANTSGQLDIIGIIGNGGGVTAVFTVTPSAPPPVAPSRPDLVPTVITVGSNPVVVGRKVHFDSGIRNTGGTGTGVFNIKWLVDGRDVGAYGSHAGIPAGTLVMNGNSQFDWTFTTAGRHSVEFIADVDKMITESNEANNSQVVVVDVAAPAPAPVPVPVPAPVPPPVPPPAPLPPGARGFVVMGDSYSSGEGNPAVPGGYLSPTDTADDHCHRSTAAYGPMLSAAAPKAGTLKFGTDTGFIACSGATTSDYFNFNSVNNEPSQKTSLSAFQAAHDVKTIVLTLGGNDMYFGSVVQTCLAGDCSKDTAQAGLRKAIEQSFKALQNGKGPATYSLSSVLKDIHARAPHANIFVGAYPRIFGSNIKYYPQASKQGKHYGPHQCGIWPGVAVTYANAQWMNALADRLNGVLAGEVAKAKKAGVPATFVSVRAAFTTHGLCDSGATWINYPRITKTAAPNLIGTWGTWQESDHPNKAGHLAYEKLMRKAMGV